MFNYKQPKDFANFWSYDWIKEKLQPFLKFKNTFIYIHDRTMEYINVY